MTEALTCSVEIVETGDITRILNEIGEDHRQAVNVDGRVRIDIHGELSNVDTLGIVAEFIA